MLHDLLTRLSDTCSTRTELHSDSDSGPTWLVQFLPWTVNKAVADKDSSVKSSCYPAPVGEFGHLTSKSRRQIINC